LGFELIFLQAILLLAERDRTSFTHKIPIVLHVEEEHQETFNEAMASRDAKF